MAKITPEQLKTRNCLLNELDNVHQTICKQLADNEEEVGNHTIAKGWRWLGDNNRIPSSRNRGGLVYWAFTFRKDWRSYNHYLPTEVFYNLSDRMMKRSKSEAMRIVARAVGFWLEANEEIEKMKEEAKKKMDSVA